MRTVTYRLFYKRLTRYRRLRDAVARLQAAMSRHVNANAWDMTEAEHAAYMQRGARQLRHYHRLQDVARRWALR